MAYLGPQVPAESPLNQLVLEQLRQRIPMRATHKKVSQRTDRARGDTGIGQHASALALNILRQMHGQGQFGAGQPPLLPGLQVFAPPAAGGNYDRPTLGQHAAIKDAPVAGSPNDQQRAHSDVALPPICDAPAKAESSMPDLSDADFSEDSVKATHTGKKDTLEMAAELAKSLVPAPKATPVESPGPAGPKKRPASSLLPAKAAKLAKIKKDLTFPGVPLKSKPATEYGEFTIKTDIGSKCWRILQDGSPLKCVTFRNNARENWGKVLDIIVG